MASTERMEDPLEVAFRSAWKNSNRKDGLVTYGDKKGYKLRRKKKGWVKDTSAYLEVSMHCVIVIKIYNPIGMMTFLA